jgi:hypothetical protein
MEDRGVLQMDQTKLEDQIFSVNLRERSEKSDMDSNDILRIASLFT